MKTLKLMTLLFFTSSLTLDAYDLSGLLNENLVCDVNKTLKTPLPKKRKHAETRYEKVERKLSEYRGTWFKDMMIYSVDIFMPDEMTRAVKDVMKNRQALGFTDQTEKLPKTFLNDSYNVALTTAYYYMQDMSRITERIWKDQACTPDHFEYDMRKEPKTPFLDLNECDPMARGVTKNGIVLPLNENFPSALYPYASKPDGCSAEGLQTLFDQLNNVFDDGQWIENVCNAHDKCYYTEGSTIKECNSKFMVEMVDACTHISTTNTLTSMGMKNTFCGMKGFWVASAANACAHKYFANAQKKQHAYNLWVKRYEKVYKEAKQQIVQNKGQ